MERITPAQLIWVMVVNGGHCTRKIPKGGRWGGSVSLEKIETSIAAFVPCYHCCPRGGTVPGDWQWNNDVGYYGVSVLRLWTSVACLYPNKHVIMLQDNVTNPTDIFLVWCFKGAILCVSVLYRFMSIVCGLTYPPTLKRLHWTHCLTSVT